MFEMFVLLINEINPHSFCFVSYLFSFYLHAWSSPTQRMLHTILCIAYLSICRGNLPWLFAAGICRGFLPREIAVGICRRNLPWLFAVDFFVYISESFFVYVSKSCLHGGKPFSYVCKNFWFVRFSLLTVLLLVIVVAVIGHCKVVQKRPQKINYDVNLNYISFPICPSRFPKFCLIHKKIKNAKKLSVFGEKDSHRLSNFLQPHIFWNFDHIFRMYNKINYMSIWFLKVIRAAP